MKDGYEAAQALKYLQRHELMGMPMRVESEGTRKKKSKPLNLPSKSNLFKVPHTMPWHKENINNNRLGHNPRHIRVSSSDSRE